MTNWQTSLAGFLAFLSALLTALWYLADDNPATEPNWNLVIVAFIGAIGALRARDTKVSDEQAGAGRTTPVEPHIADQHRDDHGRYSKF